MQRLNPAVAEAGPLDWRHAFAKGGCRDVRPAAQYLSLASPRERHQREGDPAVRDPFGATCGARFRRGPRKLAWRLKQRAALIRLKLCSSARPEGKGSRAALRAIAALGLSVGSTRGAGSGPDSAERRHWGRSATVGSRFSRSETRAQTPIPEWWAQRGFFANLCLRHCIAVEMMSGCCWPGAAGGRMEELSFNV